MSTVLRCSAPPCPSTPHGLGPVRRAERDLVRGRETFVDDHHFPGGLVGYVLRSPHPHARIRGVDASRARAAPEVALVLTAADLVGVADPLPYAMPLTSFGGQPRAEADRPILAADHARHVGDGVALVVAATRKQAAAYARLYESTRERDIALANWLHFLTITTEPTPPSEASHQSQD